MAYDAREQRKAELRAELAQARASLAHEMTSTRQSLDVNLRLKQAVAKRRAFWLTGAAVTGWLIARLPGRSSRKKKAAKPSSNLLDTLGSISGLGGSSKKSASISPAERNGWLLALLGVIGTMIRPAVTSYLTQRLNDYLTRDHSPLKPIQKPSSRGRNLHR